MFSVMKTELKIFPLCTRNVWPTKSGVTIERRDQVLIAFFEPEAFILSIFSKKSDSTNSPSFIVFPLWHFHQRVTSFEVVQNCPLTRASRNLTAAARA